MKQPAPWLVLDKRSSVKFEERGQDLTFVVAEYSPCRYTQAGSVSVTFNWLSFAPFALLLDTGLAGLGAILLQNLFMLFACLGCLQYRI